MSSDFIQKIRAQSHLSISIAISIIEDSIEAGNKLLSNLFKYTGHAYRIGITGPPGAGKSSITNELIKKFRAKDKKVAALLVDPSSPFTNGSILGDRIRMGQFYKDEDVYIRSIASRGSRGGLSENIDYVADILEYYGYEIIIFETVGVGQIELDVIESVDSVVVVLVPESGDDIQMMKAGLIEIADIYAINKYDRQDSNKLYLALSNMLKLLDYANWVPKIVKTVAIEGTGINSLYKNLMIHNNYLVESMQINKKLDQRYVYNVKNIINKDFEDKFWTKDKKNIIQTELKKDIKKRKNIYKLADIIKSI